MQSKPTFLVTLQALPADIQAEAITFKALLTLPDTTQWPLSFTAPGHQAPMMGNVLNGTLTGVLQPLMCLSHTLPDEQRLTLHVEGALSPSLVWRLNEFQAMWSVWGPYRRVNITADAWAEPPVNGQGSILAFSGGADSCYTAWQLTRSDTPQPISQLDSLLWVHGFDIALSDSVGFSRALQSAQNQADSLGRPLYWVRTNLRQLHDQYLNWEQSHASAIAAALMLFQQSHRAAVLSNTYPYQSLVFPWGSNPITDPLLGSLDFPLIPYGAAVDRLTKLKTLLAWPEGLHHLRVCWQPGAQGSNCGQCAKCIRYRVMFSVLGVERPLCFGHNVYDLATLLRSIHLTPAMYRDFQTYYALATPLGLDWLPTMATTLRRAAWRFQAKRLMQKLTLQK